MIELPEAIRTSWRAFDIHVEALWALDIEPEAMPIEKLLWHLDLPLWPDGDQHFALTPRQVLRAPFRYETLYKRMRAVSLMFPIEVTRYNGRWLIVDGVKRLVKSHEDGIEEMFVRKVPRKLLGG